MSLKNNDWNETNKPMKFSTDFAVVKKEIVARRISSFHLFDEQYWMTKTNQIFSF